MTPFKSLKRIASTAQDSNQQIPAQKKKRNLFSYKPLFASSNVDNQDVNKEKRVCVMFFDGLPI